MAYIAGYVTAEEKKELIRRGWQVEPAEKYNLVSSTDDDNTTLMVRPTEPGSEAVVIFVDNSLFSIVSGPDWDTESITEASAKITEVSAKCCFCKNWFKNKFPLRVMHMTDKGKWICIPCWNKLTEEDKAKYISFEDTES